MNTRVRPLVMSIVFLLWLVGYRRVSDFGIYPWTAPAPVHRADRA
jgi:hypothetical protein